MMCGYLLGYMKLLAFLFLLSSPCSWKSVRLADLELVSVLISVFERVCIPVYVAGGSVASVMNIELKINILDVLCF